MVRSGTRRATRARGAAAPGPLRTRCQDQWPSRVVRPQGASYGDRVCTRWTKSASAVRAAAVSSRRGASGRIPGRNANSPVSIPASSAGSFQPHCTPSPGPEEDQASASSEPIHNLESGENQTGFLGRPDSLKRVVNGRSLPRSSVSGISMLLPLAASGKGGGWAPCW